MNENFSKFNFNKQDIAQNYYNNAKASGQMELAEVVRPVKEKIGELSFMNKHLTNYALQNPQKFDKYHKLINTEAKYLSAIKSSIKDVQQKDELQRSIRKM